MNYLLPTLEISLANVKGPIAVAVSGGADSFALLLLAQKWAEQKGEHIVALTVDHGLRSDSASEAQRVQEWVLNRGIEHVILKWEGEKPSSRLQEKARDVRYQLLISWCKAHNISTLLLGHHAQDQEETFWLRLSSGSGLNGLAGMQERRMKDGITMIRPLLSLKQEQLKEILRAENQEWIEDPSNKNQKFFRGRFRSFLKEEGLSSERLLKTMEKLQEDVDFIQETLKKTLKTLVQHHALGYFSFQKEDFDALHPALTKRVLSHLMQWFSGEGYPPRSEQIQGVLAKLTTGCSFTAGGIYWFHEGKKIYLSREPSVIEKPLCLKDIYEKTLWDQRFWIDPEIKACFSKEAYIGVLKSEGRKSLLSHPTTTAVPRRIWPTLLAIWVKEEVVAIPHLCYTTSKSEQDLEKIIYLKPPFHDSLRFTI